MKYHNFHVILPQELLARITTVMKRLDESLINEASETIRQDLERRNDWGKGRRSNSHVKVAIHDEGKIL